MASLKYTVDVDTKGARSSIASLERSLGGLGSFIAGGFAVTELVRFGDELISLQNKLRAFSGSQAEANAKFEQIAAIAGRSRSELGAVGDLYNKMAIASAELGYNQEQVGKMTETFTKSLKVGGATAEQSASAILQFSQAMGSGVLRGEEFNAVFEASSSTMMDLAKALGVPVGQMRKLAEEGKLTSKVVGDALLKMQQDVDQKFAKTTSTVGEAFTNLKTAAGIAFTELGTEPGIGKGIADIAASLITLTGDVKQLSVVIKELVEVLTILGLTFVAIKAVAFISPLLVSASAGATKLSGAFAALIAEGKVLPTLFGSIKSGAGGLGARLASAFSLTAIKGSITTIVNLGKNMAMLIPIMLKTGNIFTGVRTIIGGVIGIFGRLIGVLPLILKGFLRFIPIAGWIWTIWEAIDALLKLFTGNGLIYYLDQAATSIDNFFEKFLGVRIIDWVQSKISSLMEQLRGFAEYLNILDKKTPKGGKGGGREAQGGANRAETDAFDASLGRSKTTTPVLTVGGKKTGSGKSAKEIAKEQADALRDVKDAVLEVTKAFNESSKARLEDLDFQFKSLGMSEDQVALESQRRDIIREQASAIADLDAKQKDIQQNESLSAKGREEALALLAQQRTAIDATAAAELAASEKTLQAIQAENIKREQNLKLMELKQQANSNRAALQNLEDELTLIGLYGDKLDEVTAQIQLQQRLREIEVEFQNQLLALEEQKLKLGKERYEMELAMLQQGKAQAVAAATATAAAQKKVDDAQKKSERNDVGAALRKRFEELERSVDPAVTALQGLDSLFGNMTSALDNFVETGKLKFGDLAKSIIADLAKIALKAAVTKLFTLVGKSILGKAAGGPVMANKPYVVGEQGPELFVPNSAGSIMTNASMNKNAGADSGMGATVTNNYITNNISAIDSRSVAQMFVENRKSLLGASMMARKEMPYGG